MDTVYAVGSPYFAGVTNWEERADYNVRRGFHEMRLFISNVSPLEVLLARIAPVTFSLCVVDEDVAFVAMQMGNFRVDSSFSIHLVSLEERVIPDGTRSPDTRALVNIILVDANTGILRALRTVTVSPEFTQAFDRVICAQAARPFPADYDERVARIAARHDTQSLIAHYAASSCRGGD